MLDENESAIHKNIKAIMSKYTGENNNQYAATEFHENETERYWKKLPKSGRKGGEKVKKLRRKKEDDVYEDDLN